MKFDLHMHTTISDGSMPPERVKELILNKNEITAVTDHDDPSYHLMNDNGCSFTGIEITSHIWLDTQNHLVEFLFYGFSKDDIPALRFDNVKKHGLPLPELAEYLHPIKERTGAKLFMAHPGYYYRNANKILLASLPYIDGVECLHPSASAETAEKLILFCKEHNKLASGGGDTHSMGFYEGTPYLHLADKYPEVFNWMIEMKNNFCKVQNGLESR